MISRGIVTLTTSSKSKVELTKKASSLITCNLGKQEGHGGSLGGGLMGWRNTGMGV